MANASSDAGYVIIENAIIDMGNSRGVRRDFDALEKRRLDAVRLVVEEGLSQSEAARRVQAAQQSVSRWINEHGEHGAAGLRKAGCAGRKPLLDAKQLKRLDQMLLQGSAAHGFSTPLWTCPRVARLIADEFGVRYHEGHVWKILRALNWSPQRPVGKARERNEEAIRNWRPKTWPSTDGPVLIVWDRLPAHRSRLVREFIELSEGHIVTEFLPPYAPELNPVEHIWAYWRQHELPNVCPKHYWELDERARKSLRRMRRKPRLITPELCTDSA